MSQSHLTHSRAEPEAGRTYSRPPTIFREHFRSESCNRKFHAHTWLEPRDCIVLSDDEDESLAPVAAQVGLGSRIRRAELGLLFWGSIFGVLAIHYAAPHYELEDIKPIILGMLNYFILLLQRAGNLATLLATMIMG